MKATALVAQLQDLIRIHGDLHVEVSVDLSTEDRTTKGDRAYGQVYAAWASAGRIAILSTCGVLNFDTLTRRLACPVRTSFPALSSAVAVPRPASPSACATAGPEPGEKAAASTAAGPSRKSSRKNPERTGSRRPLGAKLRSLLLVLDNPGWQRPRGVWHHRSGWTWGTYERTVQMLETLKARGIVECDPELASEVMSIPTQTYRLTAAGEAMIRILRQVEP